VGKFELAEVFHARFKKYVFGQPSSSDLFKALISKVFLSDVIKVRLKKIFGA